MKTVRIPETWTAKEASAVYDFLSVVMEKIWAHYGNQMLEIWLQEKEEPTDQIDWIQPDDGFDEIPF